MTSTPSVLLLGLGWFPDARGGLERYTAGLLDALRAAPSGTRAEAIALGPLTAAPPGVHVAADASDPLPRRLAGMALATRARAGDHDIVDAHFALTALVAGHPWFRRGRPLVAHFHGPWALEGGTSGPGFLARRAVERRALGRADLVVTLSVAFADVAIDHARVSPWRIAVEPPGVDLDRFHPVPPGERRRLRARWIDDPAQPIVVCARRLVTRTGVDVLLDAWALLPTRTDGAEPVLLIVGDGPERPALEARAAGLGSGTAPVRFLGPVDDRALADLYRAADVTVVPTRTLEGFGLVTLESMACGTPAVVTRVGGLPEALAGLPHPETMVVPPEDARALADRLADGFGGRHPFPDADRCRATAERHRWEDVATRHLRRYRAVLEPSPELRVLTLDHVARWSGGEIALARVLPHLPARVHAVLFEAGPLGAALTAAGITHEVRTLDPAVRDLRRARTARPSAVAATALRSTGFTVGLARRIRHLAPDVVHANSLKAGLLGGLAARAAGRPLVWHVRDRITEDELPRPAAVAVRFAVRHLADAVVVNSHTTLASLGPARPGQARLVLHDPYRRPEPADDHQRPAPTRSTGGIRTIAMVGRLAPWKGHDVFLRAFAAAFPTGPARAVVAGAALFGEVAWAESLLVLADQLGIAERVRWLGSVDDVETVLDGADVVVHASVVPEPFGQVVVEAMAAGAAVVATDAGGPAEILVDGRTGVLVPPGDVDALADALRALDGEPDRRRRLGAAAAGAAAEGFDPDDVGARLADFLRAAADAPRRRRR